MWPGVFAGVAVCTGVTVPGLVPAMGRSAVETGAGTAFGGLENQNRMPVAGSSRANSHSSQSGRRDRSAGISRSSISCMAFQPLSVVFLSTLYRFWFIFFKK